MGLLWLCKLVVLTAKLQVWRCHELVFLQGWVGCGVEWSLSTPITQLHAIGNSKDACTFHANSWWSSWSGTSCSSCHQMGMSTCWACHCIHSTFCMGEGSGSSGVEVHGRPSSAAALARNVSSPLNSSWRWGSSDRDTLIPLLLPPPLTSQNCCTLCPHFPRSAGASDRLCPPWHLFLGYPQMMRGPPLS